MDNLNIAVAFIAGLASFFSPCFFPMLPAYVSLISGEATQNKPLQVLPSILLFVIGFSLVFSVMGLSLGFVSQLLAPYKETLSRIAGLFLIFFGLSIGGIIKIPFLMKERKPLAFRGSAITMGIAFGFAWTPCIGLVLGNIFALVGSTGSVSKGVILLIAYNVGLGLPFIILGTFFSYLISTFNFLKKYNNFIYKSSAVLFVSFGIFLATGYFQELLIWIFRITQ